MSLVDIVKMVEAAEMGKATQALVSGSGGVCWISEHQRKKQGGKQEKFERRGQAGKPGDRIQCSFCGRSAHSRDSCPAKDVKCHGCDRVGHFKSRCRDRKDNSKKKVAELKDSKGEEVSLNTLAVVSEDDALGDDDFFAECLLLSAKDQHEVLDQGTVREILREGKVTGPSAVVGGLTQQQAVRHMRCDRLGRWYTGKVEKHGRCKVKLKVCDEAYSCLEPPRKPPVASKGAAVSMLADTGAQMCVTGVKVASQLGLKYRDLVPTVLCITGANNRTIETLGAMFLTLEGAKGNKSNQMVYVARGVNDFYLSKEACRDLGIISASFPEVECKTTGLGSRRRRSSSAPPPPTSLSGLGTLGEPTTMSGVYQSGPNAVLSSEPLHDDVFAPGAMEPVARVELGATDLGKFMAEGDYTLGRDVPPIQGPVQEHRAQPTTAYLRGGFPQDSKEQGELGASKGTQHDAMGRRLASCGCLERSLPPERPDKMPFDAKPENSGRLQEWLLNYYAASTFNNCKHQKLPMMRGAEPMRLLLKEGAEPVAVHKPATIPAHWQEAVRADIERDIKLGVLERVPQNTPVTWCSRMHVVAKKSGEPRRTVDFRPVNAASRRQTHYVEPPFAQARGVPPRTWRFTSDAWNGYHSVPLDPRDRHITTFITPWGRLWYTGGPQGHVVMGDAFNAWYDSVIRDLPRKKKCVDDVSGWADTLDQLFWDTVDFLEVTGNHGIIQNPEKFCWGRRELEFVGFWLTEDGIRPTDETCQAIREFPWPTDITGIRSWFGLIEQVTFAFAKTELMEPFRALLKPKSEFVWNDAL